MPIELKREDPKSLRGYCTLCFSPNFDWPLHATYTFISEDAEKEGSTIEDIVLCPPHELELMEKMINNYQKRFHRTNSNPPAGKLMKKEEKEDEDAHFPIAGNS